MLEASPTALDIQPHEKSAIDRLSTLTLLHRYIFCLTELSMNRCRDVLMDSESKMEYLKWFLLIFPPDLWKILSRLLEKHIYNITFALRYLLTEIFHSTYIHSVQLYLFSMFIFVMFVVGSSFIFKVAINVSMPLLALCRSLFITYVATRTFAFVSRSDLIVRVLCTYLVNRFIFLVTTLYIE